jgi:polyketide biosynthesis acyl carrier protein
MMQEKIFEVVRSTVLDVLVDFDQNMIDINKSLKDLGANSVDRIEIINSSIERLNVRLPLIAFKDVKNIKELVDVIYENIEK